MAAQGDLSKLVSLTFDESPKVRIEAAESLGKLDDPAVIFALVELSYDKEPNVRKRAQEILEEKKNEEADVMSFAEIFSRGTKKEKDKEAKKNAEGQPMDKKEKILSPITNIFEKRLGKENAEKVKAKMMPTIEKIYRKSSTRGRITSEEHGREVIQEFLTSYLEAVSGINGIGPAPAAPEASAEQPAPAVEEAEELPVVPPESAEVVEGVEEELDEIGTRERKLDRISREIMEIEAGDYAEIREEMDIEKSLPDSFFKRAYETMMLSNGDEDLMKREMKRMLSQAEKDINTAFRLARDRFKERKITNITKIKSGMRNINTDVLSIKEVENMEYNKTKKQKAVATRAIVNDEDGNEGVLYLFDDRGDILRPDMKIRVVKGHAKTFDFSGETALTIGKKGNVYIVL